MHGVTDDLMTRLLIYKHWLDALVFTSLLFLTGTIARATFSFTSYLAPLHLSSLGFSHWYLQATLLHHWHQHLQNYIIYTMHPNLNTAGAPLAQLQKPLWFHFILGTVLDWLRD